MREHTTLPLPFTGIFLEKKNNNKKMRFHDLLIIMTDNEPSVPLNIQFQAEMDSRSLWFSRRQTMQGCSSLDCIELD